MPGSSHLLLSTYCLVCLRVKQAIAFSVVELLFAFLKSLWIGIDVGQAEERLLFKSISLYISFYHFSLRW